MVDISKARPCIDCGGRFPAVCMDYDHIPGATKLGDVAKIRNGTRWRATFTEIAKCEVVCANCHRLRTQGRLHADA